MNVRDRLGGDEMRLAANVLGVLVLIAAVAPFVVYAVPAAVGADHGFIVLSGSMEPTLSPGDAIVVREASPAQIERGDIITFQTGDEAPTTHRVVEIRDSESGVAYVTKGDANEEADRQTVSHSQVVGEVMLVIPYLGFVIQFANSQLGFLLLVLVPLGLFVLSELRELATAIGGSQADGTAPSAQTTSSSESQPPTGAQAGADDSGFTLTRSSLQLILLLLGFYLPYSGYVAYTTREAWSIGAATATAIAFLFCLVTFLATRGSGSGSGQAARSTEGVVRHGSLPARIGDRTTVPLASVEALVQMAVDRDDWVIYDEDRNTYYIARDDALYLHRSAPETDGGVVDAETQRDPAGGDGS